jgi:hypothetical protein
VDKKQKSILIWILTWAGLLLAVLYSPVGSPDLYAPIHYFSANQGVMFNNTEIANAPTIKPTAENNSSGLSIQSYDSERKSQSLYALSGSTFESSRISGHLSGNSNSESVNVKGNNSGGSMIGVSPMLKGRSSSNGATTQNTGIISLTTDMTMLEDFSTNKQSVGAGDGGTDPGGDPSGPPIPVGEGWIFLLVLVSVYSIWKKFKI